MSTNKIFKLDLPDPPKLPRHVFESTPFRSGVVPTSGTI